MTNSDKHPNFETMDCTPTWAGLLPMMLELYAQFNKAMYKAKCMQQDTDNYNNNRTEFLRMAQAADKWNAHCKEQNDIVKANFEALISTIPQLVLERLYNVEGSPSTLLEILTVNNNDIDVEPITPDEIKALIDMNVNDFTLIGHVYIYRLS